MYGDEHTPATDHAVKVVVIAASFGGLTALRTVLPALRDWFPVPVAVVLHRSAAVEDRMAEILAIRSGLPVDSAGAGYRLRPGRVAVLPAGTQARLRADGVVDLGEPGRLSADLVLTDAVGVYGPGVLAVVLTGKLSDGAAGVRAVKRAGGLVVVQDPDESAAPGMPTAALSTGCVDHRLPLALIAPAIVTLTAAPGAAAMLRVPASPWATLEPAAG